MISKSEKDRRYLRRADAAEYLGVSVRTFDTWIAEKRMRVVRAGGRVLADRRDLDAFYESLKVSAA